MGVIKVTPDTASLISVCDMLDDMKVSAMENGAGATAPGIAVLLFRISENNFA